MYTINIPVISTGHITESDAAVLAELAKERPQRLAVAGDEYSFWVWVENCPDAAGLGLSASFGKIVEWAKANEFDYVRLDRDGDLLEDAIATGALDQHDW